MDCLNWLTERRRPSPQEVVHLLHVSCHDGWAWLKWTISFFLSVCRMCPRNASKNIWLDCSLSRISFQSCIFHPYYLMFTILPFYLPIIFPALHKPSLQYLSGVNMFLKLSIAYFIVNSTPVIFRHSFHQRYCRLLKTVIFLWTNICTSSLTTELLRTFGDERFFRSHKFW